MEIEEWELYDGANAPSGRRIMRGEDIPEGYRHMVVHICVFNSGGELLRCDHLSRNLILNRTHNIYFPSFKILDYERIPPVSTLGHNAGISFQILFRGQGKPDSQIGLPYSGQLG